MTGPTAGATGTDVSAAAGANSTGNAAPSSGDKKPAVSFESQEDFEKAVSERAAKAVSARLNEEKQKTAPVLESLRADRQDLETLAALTGMTVEQAKERIRQAHAVASGNAQATYGGAAPAIDPAAYRANQDAKSAREVAIEAKLIAEEVGVRENPLIKQAGDWEEVKDTVKEYAKANNTSLEQAYWAANGQNAAKRLAKGAEHLSTANNNAAPPTIQGEGGAGGATGASTGKSRGLSVEQLEAARLTNMDPNLYAKMIADPNGGFDLEDYMKLTGRKPIENPKTKIG